MKRFVRNITICLFCAIGIISCNTDIMPENFAPSVNTLGADAIYRKGATLRGNIYNPSNFYVQEFGVEYTSFMDLDYKLPTRIPIEQTDEDNNFSVQLDSLTPGAYYRYRAYAYSGHNFTYGKDTVFQLPPMTAPIFGETIIDSMSYTSFNIAISLLDNGGANIYNSGFIYIELKEQTNTQDLLYDTPNVKRFQFATNYTTDSTFRTIVQNLNPGKHYAIRPYAFSSYADNGLGYGEVVFVQTKVSKDLLLSSCDSVSASKNSLTLKASVLSYGNDSISELGFCYSDETKEPEPSFHKKEAKLENDEFQATITDLDAGTNYYIRAYAIDTIGNIVYGAVMQYTVPIHDVLEVTTYQAEKITTIKATLQGGVRNNRVRVKEKGFCWNTDEINLDIYNSSNKKVDGQETFSCEIDVDYNTHYYYRAYAINNNGELFYGNIVEFNSSDLELPELVLDEANTITENSANIKVTAILNYPYRKGHFLDYGLLISSVQNNPYLDDNEVYQYSEKVELDANITGERRMNEKGFLISLNPDTQYYYRAYSINEVQDTVYSVDVKQFRTLKRTPNQEDMDFPSITSSDKN